jgi:Ca2+-transporting ATPase
MPSTTRRSPQEAQPTAPLFHTQEAAEVLSALGTQPGSGLSAARAGELLAEHGPNELEERAGRGPLAILWEQLTATMVLILVAAGVVSLFLSKWSEATAIFAIVILFALLGFVQEYRAERAMAALKKLAVPSVRVRRDGKAMDLPARSLVPGDVVLLEAGNVIPADCRLFEVASLRVQESALTGESEAVEKETHAVPGVDLPVGDRRNMAYMGTVVTYGRAAGVVVATGMRTELGHVATLLQRVEDDTTPLQKRLDRVGKGLAAVGVGIAALVAIFGVLRGESLADMFLVAVSVAVAIVPEGLPAVVTITLALGARRMLARNALIRKLPAVETLGSVSVICSDKTGTLTQNRMTVTAAALAHGRVELRRPGAGEGALAEELPLLFAAGALASDAELGEDKEPTALGDPTEAALVVVAALHGLRKGTLEETLPRVAELPFDSDRKRMTTFHEVKSAIPGLAEKPAFIAFTKGSLDGLLDASSHAFVRGERVPMDAAIRASLEAENARLAGEGKRVLGVAYRTLDALPGRVTIELEQGLVLIGMLGMIDPPRPEVKLAVATCRRAGIRPVMITGDHPLTAVAIARELGILGPEGGVAVTGPELEHMDAARLGQTVESASVFARVSPEHKLRIVEALQAQGHVVAMTGDGVNDAPALKKADIGVAMGITGTDVTKEAGEVVLQDDNFATIVAAVEEGRVIFDNIKKFVKFSIAGNLGKVAVMILAPALALLLPASSLGELVVPLLPLQLLWLNLLTDGLLGVGLGVDPAERRVMRRAPIATSAGIFSGGALGDVVRTGVVIGAVALVVGLVHHQQGNPDWQTMMFTTLALAQVFQALAIRSATDSVFHRGVAHNATLLGLAALVVGLQLSAIYVPALGAFLGATPLAPLDLLVCLGAAALVLVFSELEKLWHRRREGDEDSAPLSVGPNSTAAPRSTLESTPARAS